MPTAMRSLRPLPSLAWHRFRFKNQSFIVLALLLVLFSHGVAVHPMSAKRSVLEVDDLKIHESLGHHTAFALRLSNRVPDGADNVAISPLSIHVALALVAAGANGQTRDQIVSALAGPGGDLDALATHVVAPVLADGSALGGPKLSYANGVFIQQSLKMKPTFNDTVVGLYKSEVKAVDFETKAEERMINSWVEEATAGLIKDLIPDGACGRRTKLVLVNALYFKGEWKQKFAASRTRKSEFHLLDGTSTQVPFMTTRDDQFISTYDQFKVLRLPYAKGRDGRQFSMYVFLPNAPDGIGNLQEMMSSDPEFLSRHLPQEKVEVGDFKLPKFKISFGFEASTALKELGIELPFSDLGDADFSEMVHGDDKLRVSAVQHKCFVEVNEEGTEAAAATAAVIMEFTSLTPRVRTRVDFVADHPFVFFVREDTTGAMLFAGHVKNPSLAA